MGKEVLIEFSGISKSFQGKKVLENIHLKIYKEDIFALIGKSGSGKSTLLNILLGIYKPDFGKIHFKNKDITGNSGYIKKIIGLTTQENSFYDKLTVYENMKYYANLYNLQNFSKEKILHLLESVDLKNSADSLGENLSGGMKRRLDFVISIIHDPDILILDEPTTGLDPLLVIQFWDLVKSFRNKGKTIIVISHIFQEIEDNCSRGCILNKGKIAVLLDITNKTKLLHEFIKATK